MIEEFHQLVVVTKTQYNKTDIFAHFFQQSGSDIFDSVVAYRNKITFLAWQSIL